MSDEHSAQQYLLRLAGKMQALVASLSISLNNNSLIKDRRFAASQPSQQDAILFPDLSFFDNPDRWDQQRDADPKLVKAFEMARREHYARSQKIYNALESVYKLSCKLKQFYVDLDRGFYIQESIDTILSGDSKQLAAECLSLLGFSLLLCDHYCPGITRERILVAFRRWKGVRSNPAHFNEICTLFRRTDYSGANFRDRYSFTFPQNYPESFFVRLDIFEHVITRICACLRTEDIYHQIQHYPSPEDRCAALSTQSSLLVICLFFAPSLLHQDHIKMREICDRHFSENFVVSLYMGYTVDLSVVWDRYSAAKSAMSLAMEPSRVRSNCDYFFKQIEALNIKLSEYCKEGVLNDEFVLENTDTVLSCIRQANIVLKWIILHQKTSSNSKSNIQEYFSSTFDKQAFVELLLNCSHLELVFRESLSRLLSQKQAQWGKFRADASKSCSDLGHYFSGQKELSRIQKNEELNLWFDNISKQISALSHSNSILSGRCLFGIIDALNEIKELPQFHPSPHIRAFIMDIVSILRNMHRLLNIKESILITLSQVTDFSYAWYIMPNYTDHFQSLIQRQPSIIAKLRAVFIKLTSAMDIPLLRINQAGSCDMAQVSNFYSNYLVRFIERVLHVIPKTMFITIDKIIESLNDELLSPPNSVIESNRLKSMIMYDERLGFARNLSLISDYTMGYLTLQRTLVGVIKVDPYVLLENGIRKELSLRISAIFKSSMERHSSKKLRDVTLATFNDLVTSTGKPLQRIKAAIKSIQDQLNVAGLDVYQEELGKILRSDCQHAKVILLEHGIPNTDNLRFKNCQNFTVAVVILMTLLTNPKYFVFQSSAAAWKRWDTPSESVNLQTFSDIISFFGFLYAKNLQSLFSAAITLEMLKLKKILQNVVSAEGTANPFGRYFSLIRNSLLPLECIPKECSRVYPYITTSFPKILSSLGFDCFGSISKIGQFKQIIRLIDYQLNVARLQQIPIIVKAKSEIDWCTQAQAQLQTLSLEPSTALFHDQIEDQEISQENAFDISLFIFSVLYTSAPLFRLDEASQMLVPMVQKNSSAICSSSLTTGLLFLINSLPKSISEKVIDDTLKISDQYFRSVTSLKSSPNELKPDYQPIIRTLLQQLFL